MEFEVNTINISNDSDEEALKVLESDSIQNGLKLINATSTTLAPLTTMAQGLMQILLKRNRNKLVQSFNLGFDFSNSAVEVARLRTGTYIAAQIKRDLLNWDEWCYDKRTGLIVRKDDNTIRLEVNHLTFNITKYE